jgi:hypothetical protein
VKYITKGIIVATIAVAMWLSFVLQIYAYFGEVIGIWRAAFRGGFHAVLFVAAVSVSLFICVIIFLAFTLALAGWLEFMNPRNKNV